MGSIIIRVILAVFLLSISRIGLVLLAPGCFGELEANQIAHYYFKGLRFDLSAALYLNALFILLCSLPFPFRLHKAYRMVCSIAYILPNSLGLLANLADAGYFPYSLKRTTSEVLRAMNEAADINRLAMDYIRDFWYLIIIWLIMIALLVFINKAYNYGLGNKKKSHWKTFAKNTSIFLVMILLVITGMRGGWQLKPISIITASIYAPSALHSQLILNTPFTILTTLDNKAIPDPSYFPDLDSAAKVFNPVQENRPKDEFNPLNVVIIILESFGSEYSAHLNPKGTKGCTGFTPFLDSLMQVSTSFNGFANGTRSIEAVAAIISGLPSLIHIDFISSQFAGNCIPSLPLYLKEEGYTSAFYHGGHNGTMNFDAYARKSGFDYYYGLNEYNNLNDYDGKWGIYDEPFLKYFSDGLSNLKPPFLGLVFTLSSHHPYNIPDKYKQEFKGGNHPIHQTIQYSDNALRHFFYEARKSSWYSHTLFVITADHTSVGCETLSEDPLGRYRIPILFYRPGAIPDDPSGKIVQQCDIYPSILDILNYKQPYLSFGQSYLHAERLNFALAGQGGAYYLRYADTLVYFSDGNAKSTFLYTEGVISRPLIEKETDGAELLGKALLHQYIYRLNHNLLCQIR